MFYVKTKKFFKILQPSVGGERSERSAKRFIIQFEITCSDSHPFSGRGLSKGVVYLVRETDETLPFQCVSLHLGT